MIKPNIEEYFKNQAEFNQWLNQLTDHERDHIIYMLSDVMETICSDICTLIGFSIQEIELGFEDHDSDYINFAQERLKALKENLES